METAGQDGELTGVLSHRATRLDTLMSSLEPTERMERGGTQTVEVWWNLFSPTVTLFALLAFLTSCLKSVSF